jgi:hypothetical protein
MAERCEFIIVPKTPKTFGDAGLKVLAVQKQLGIDVNIERPNKLSRDIRGFRISASEKHYRSLCEALIDAGLDVRGPTGRPEI